MKFNPQSSMRSSIKLLSLAVLSAMTMACSDDAPKKQPERVVTVTSTKVERETIVRTVPGVGSLRAIEISTMAPEVAGNVIGRYFEDGQRVERGDILYTLDRRTQEAQLDVLQAQYEEQEWIWGRMKILAETQAASEAEVVEAAYTLESLKAQVAEQQSIVDKLTIRCPFKGRVAIHKIDVGTYANVGDELVKVVNDSVMLVDYELATMWLPLLKVGQSIEMSTDSDPGRSYSGRVTAINPFVNDSTRSVLVRAQVPNPEYALRSGLYAYVTQTIGSYPDVLVVPQASLVYTTTNELVYAVVDGRAVSVPVELVRKIDDARAIVRPVVASSSTGTSTSNTNGTSGSTKQVVIKAGLEIVAEGALKIRPGSKLKTMPYVPADVSVVTGLPSGGSAGGN
ncbi:MAG: efflux RND transporter periplasmic adaptor subunit [Phycisphaerales bacterium]|nr:efflux RND transporter periplasmic adaptor subunit [Phycisphaerales bacterium]